MTTSLNPELFTAVDAAWLHMDQPGSLAEIVGFLFLDRPLDLEELRSVVDERLLVYRRFRQRVGEPRLGLGLPVWERDPDFSLSRHVCQFSLPEPGDEDALRRWAADLYEEPMDPRHPLWYLYLIDNYGGGSVVVARMHHCIADGIALMQVLFSLTDATPGAVWIPPDIPEPQHASPLRQAAGRAWQLVESLGDQIVKQSRELRNDPEAPGELLSSSIETGQALGKILLLPPDRRTRLKQEVGPTKVGSWSQPLDLAQVKALGEVHGATVNDVLLSCIAGGLQRYLQYYDSGSDQMRTLIPVNLRPENEPAGMGNWFGLVYLTVPVGMTDPVQRLQEIHQRMKAIKDSPEAVVGLSILNLLGLTPQGVERVLVNLFGVKASFVTTNVIGPAEQRYLAGKALQRVTFWVPQPGRLGLGLSIMSYAGQVSLGAAADAELMPDVALFVECFESEYQELVEKSQLKVPVEPDQERERCQAMTKSGRRCRNRARPGKTTCHVHAGQG